MSKHYVEAYSTRSYPHAGLGSGQSEDWRTWYTREYSNGLASCKKRIANLSQKYPNTLFRLRSRDHWAHTEEIVMQMLDGKDVGHLRNYGDFETFAMRVSVWGNYDKTFRDEGTWMVTEPSEFWDWSRSNFAGKFVRVMVESPMEVNYFSRPEKNRKAEIVTIDAINAENERLAAEKRADAVAILPKSHRGFAFTENMNIITRSQLAAISARPDTSGFQEYFNLLADDIDAIAAALPKSRDLEKVELTGISRVIRKLVTR